MTGETFGQLLRHQRIGMGLSQNQLARQAGIDPAYVNRLEGGKPSTTPTAALNPRRGVVLSLANALELTDSQTDRLLFAAGLSPQEDWQTRAVRAETALASIRQALDDATAAGGEPVGIRRVG